jgi:hypothetical protein
VVVGVEEMADTDFGSVSGQSVAHPDRFDGLAES